MRESGVFPSLSRGCRRRISTDVQGIMRPGRNAPSSLEDAAAHLRGSVVATRRGGESLHSVRAAERNILREWAERHGRLFGEDPTLNLSRRSSHGEAPTANTPLPSMKKGCVGGKLPIREKQVWARISTLSRFRPSGSTAYSPESFYRPNTSRG